MNKILDTLKGMRIEKDIDVKARLIKDEDPLNPVVHFNFQRSFSWTLLKAVVVLLCAAAAIDLLIAGLVIGKRRK